jgi:hypothetical protein
LVPDFGIVPIDGFPIDKTVAEIATSTSHYQITAQFVFIKDMSPLKMCMKLSKINNVVLFFVLTSQDIIYIQKEID